MPKRKRTSASPCPEPLVHKEQEFKDESTCLENNNEANKIWIQCEKKACLKWRKITAEELKKVCGSHYLTKKMF